jgi:hypothetical protein
MTTNLDPTVRPEFAPRIRVHKTFGINIGGTKRFDAGCVYAVLPAEADLPWVKQNSTFIPEDEAVEEFYVWESGGWVRRTGDIVFDLMFARPRQEIAGGREKEKAHEARLEEAKKRRETEAAEEKRRQHEATELERAQRTAEALRDLIPNITQPAVPSAEEKRTQGAWIRWAIYEELWPDGEIPMGRHQVRPRNDAINAKIVHKGFKVPTTQEETKTRDAAIRKELPK